MSLVQVIESPRSRLAGVLALVSIHSFGVGVGLVVRPALLMELFGFSPCSQCFFPVQGGVFHVAMAIGYMMAALDVDRFRCLVIFSVVVKAVATVFLLAYFFTVESLWIVLVSGLGDGVMAALVYALLCSYDKSTRRSAIRAGVRS